MVTNLRNKFVLVTTGLLVVVLGIFLLINTLYNKYWNDIEISDMLEWIADTGVFSGDRNMEDDYLVEGMTGDENPIIGIVLDQDRRIIKKHVLGGGKDVQVSEDILERMCEYKNDSFKIGKYYYHYSEQENDQILLVVMDSSIHEKKPLKILGNVGLGIVAIILLTVVTMFLSRFVTAPAEQSILREKRFISDASHELKTPLGAISINAQALVLSGQESIYVSNILSESERMNRLIERLLTLSRLDEEPKVIFESMNISEICEEMALTYESVAFEKNINFVYDIENNLCINGDADEIRQLMAILLDNAIKNTPEAGTVGITVKESKKRTRIVVSNTGQGIRPEDLPHVFERFYTSDQSRKNNSFGLGLAIAKAITERHKGSIEAHSIPDRETDFIITI